MRSPYQGEGHEQRRFGEPIVLHRVEVMERIILARVAGASNVLDIGCGTGRFMQKLGPAVGIDLSPSMLRVARARHLQVAIADAHALPFAAGAFDAIVSTDQVFSELHDQEQALRECSRVLRAGGLLAVQCATDVIWSPRRPFRLTEVRVGLSSDRTGQRILVRALGAGFVVDTIRLWRWLRWYPYLVPMPPLPNLRLWSQGVLLLRKQRV